MPEFDAKRLERELAGDLPPMEDGLSSAERIARAATRDKLERAERLRSRPRALRNWADSQDPEPPTQPVPGNSTSGAPTHTPNTMSSRERKARRAAALAAKKKDSKKKGKK